MNPLAILLEREPEYQSDIKARLARIEGADTPLFGAAATNDNEDRGGRKVFARFRWDAGSARSG